MLTGRLNPYGGSVVDANARERLQTLESRSITLNNEFDDNAG